jgi:predicted Fe-Mo cluster-binding NifX family protein
MILTNGNENSFWLITQTICRVIVHHPILITILKGFDMKIAVTAESNNGLESPVAQHFGHAPFFMLVDVENGEVCAVQGVANPFASGHQPGQIPGFIKQQSVDVILSGGMGGRAIEFFKQAGIKAATGASGTVRQALENYLGGTLKEAAPCDESVAHGHE